MGEQKFSRWLWVTIAVAALAPWGTTQTGTMAKPGPAAPPARPVTKGYNAAIVIGVSQYRNDSKTLNLKYADRDARSFADALRLPAYGFPEENMRVLVSAPNAKAEERPSTRKEIEFALQWLGTRELTRDSTVVLYFSGHGMSRGTGGVLAAQDFDPKGQAMEGAVESKWIIDELKKLQVGMVWCVYDMCRPGLKNEELAKLSDSFELPKDAKSRFAVTFFSTKGGVSLESAEYQAGLFTHFLVEALSPVGDPPNQKLRGMRADRLVTPERIFDYVETEMKREAVAQGWDQTQESKRDYQLPEMRFTQGNDSKTGRLFTIKVPEYGVWEDPYERVKPLLKRADERLNQRNDADTYQKVFSIYTEAEFELRGEAKYQTARMDILRRAGDLALTFGDSAKAEVIFREIVTMVPRDYSARVQLAQALRIKGTRMGANGGPLSPTRRPSDWEKSPPVVNAEPLKEALEFLQPILEDEQVAKPPTKDFPAKGFPVYVRAVRLAAQLNYMLERVVTAETLVDTGLMLNPKDVDLLVLKARIIQASKVAGLGDGDSSIAHELNEFFEQAIAALIEQRTDLLAMSTSPSASEWSELNRSKLREVRLRGDYAGALIDQGKNAEARRQLEAALELALQDVEVITGIRLQLAQLVLPDEALVLYNAILKDDPRQPEALVRRADIDYANLRYDDAVAGFEKARAAQPGDIRATLGLARCYLKMPGREMEGLKLFAGLIDRDPSLSVAVLEEYIAIVESRGQVVEAQKRYALLMKLAQSKDGATSLAYVRVVQRAAHASLLLVDLDRAKYQGMPSYALNLLRGVSAVAQSQDRSLYGLMQADIAWALYYLGDTIGAKNARNLAKSAGLTNHPVFRLLN